MTSAERLINRIREFNNHVQPRATPEAHELAQQFCEACASLNERLGKCRDFLRQGMRSEAVQEARSAPSVFELAETLAFGEREKWRALCSELELAHTPEIDLETVERLKQECDQEQLLEPLLQEFRRLVHTGDRDRKIRVLRRIREHDPENPAWIENLTPLEEEELEDLQERAERAMAAEDAPEVARITNALSAPWRAVEPPAETVEKIEAWLRQRRQREAAVEAEQLIETMSDNLEQRDLQGVGTALSAWQRLRKMPDFAPSPEMVETVGKAEQWHETENQSIRREQEFEQTLESLKAQLLRPYPDPEELAGLWQRLRRFNRPLPDDLRQRVETALHEYRQAREREQSRRRKLILGAAVAAVACLLALGWLGLRQRQIARAERRITSLQQQERHQELLDYLATLEQEKTWLFRRSDGGVYRRQAKEIIRAEEEREQAFAQLRQHLQTIAADGYTAPPEEIRTLLAEAREVAADPPETAALEGWESGWNRWRQEQQTLREREFEQSLDTIEARLRTIQRSTFESAQRQRESAELQEQYREVAISARNLAPPVQERLNRLGEEIEQLRSELARQEREQAERQRQYTQLRRRLTQATDRLEDWQTAIAELLDQFPESETAADLQAAAVQTTIARDALALTSFRLPRLPTDEAAIARIEERRARLPAGRDSVWHRPLETTLAHPAIQRRLRQHLEELPKVSFYNLQQIRLREKGEDSWQTYYIADFFHQRRVEGEDGPATRYWGNVYGLTAQAMTAQAEFISVTSETHEVEFAERDAENLIPAAKYIRVLLMQLPADQSLLEHLLEALAELKARDDLAMIPRAEIMRILGNAVADGALPTTPATEAYRDLFAGINLEIPWHNRENQVVIATENRIAETIAALPDPLAAAARLSFSRRLLLASLNREVQFVGLLWPEEETRQLQPRLAPPELELLWLLQAQPGGGYSFYEVARDPEGGWNLPATLRLASGQPLFAPADHRPATELLRELDPPDDLSGLSWPDSWPRNRRQLP